MNWKGGNMGVKEQKIQKAMWITVGTYEKLEKVVDLQDYASRNVFMVQALEEKIERDIARLKRQGKWK